MLDWITRRVNFDFLRVFLDQMFFNSRKRLNGFINCKPCKIALLWKSQALTFNSEATKDWFFKQALLYTSKCFIWDIDEIIQVCSVWRKNNLKIEKMHINWTFWSVFGRPGFWCKNETENLLKRITSCLIFRLRPLCKTSTSKSAIKMSSNIEMNQYSWHFGPTEPDVKEKLNKFSVKFFCTSFELAVETRLEKINFEVTEKHE